MNKLYELPNGDWIARSRVVGMRVVVPGDTPKNRPAVVIEYVDGYDDAEECTSYYDTPQQASAALADFAAGFNAGSTSSSASV